MLTTRPRKHQSGVMLLEALIAILIFSLGVLGVVGMQASAIAASRDAKYRTDAALLANEIIGQMWVSDRRGTALETNFEGTGGTGGTSYTTWNTDVASKLPGATANPSEIAVVPGAITPGANPGTNVFAPHQVTVRVRWMSPGDGSAHQYVVQTLITQVE